MHSHRCGPCRPCTTPPSTVCYTRPSGLGEPRRNPHCLHAVQHSRVTQQPRYGALPSRPPVFWLRVVCLVQWTRHGARVHAMPEHCVALPVAPLPGWRTENRRQRCRQHRALARHGRLDAPLATGGEGPQRGLGGRKGGWPAVAAAADTGSCMPVNTAVSECACHCHGQSHEGQPQDQVQRFGQKAERSVGEKLHHWKSRAHESTRLATATHALARGLHSQVLESIQTSKQPGRTWKRVHTRCGLA